MSLQEVPFHLKRYVVEQDYSRYTPIDQAVWRCILRQLRSYLSTHAHPCYIEGLEKTGIEVDQIPEISQVSKHIERFGWKAVAVSGFIPPAAFMELQAHGFLPIASDMRTLEHLLYTPAPDIVHEAAGHAPILVDRAFAGYLKSYAQVARKAIINKQDLTLYEAIRVLSDLKEDPDSTPEQIKNAEAHLNKVSSEMGEPSEAALLGRMNWWTAEYGLIGDLNNPKIFGAGLLSSVGEARKCLSPQVKKIPFTLDCINYSYDITEMQPQLFVTPDFETLTKVLSEMAETMSFKRGGSFGLNKAKASQTINTVELDSGLQISGVLKNYVTDLSSVPSYVQFEGPTQLSLNMTELVGHGRTRHPHGFGSPVGSFKSENLEFGKVAKLRFESGVEVTGKLVSELRSPQGKLLLLTFSECTARLGDQILFDPSWGEYDMAVGEKVVSVFGGPADREHYGFAEDFVAKVIPRKKYSDESLAKQKIYADIRSLRENSELSDQDKSKSLKRLLEILDQRFTDDWLARLEILEIATALSPRPDWALKLKNQLESHREYQNADSPLRAGLELLHVS